MHQFILASVNSYCNFHILFMYHALYFPTFSFTLYVPCFHFFLIDHNQKEVLLIKWIMFFWSSKNFFCLFQLFENFNIHNVVLTSTPNINLNLTLFNVVNFIFNIRNVVSLLIWHCSMSRRHITLNTTLRQRWKVS